MTAKEEIERLTRELESLGEQIASGQSQDDLGSREANSVAMSMVDGLLARYRAAEARLAALMPPTAPSEVAARAWLERSCMSRYRSVDDGLIASLAAAFLEYAAQTGSKEP